MLVGNKSDLRQDGGNSVPTSYGEKLAMVMSSKHPPTLLYYYNTFKTPATYVLCSKPPPFAKGRFMTCRKPKWLIRDEWLPVFPQQTYNTLFCETSAKDGSNTLEAVLHLARWDINVSVSWIKKKKKSISKTILEVCSRDAELKTHTRADSF